MIEVTGRQLLHAGRRFSFTGQVIQDLAVFSFRRLVARNWRVKDTLSQLYLMGVESIPIVCICLFFISILMVGEFSFHLLKILHQDVLVPAFSTVMMLRELGPVITALLLASRVGAGMAAELATMKNTQQLEALASFRIDASDLLIVPRFVACVTATLLLTLLGAGVSVFGGALLATLQLGYNTHQYFQVIFFYASLSDLSACLLKAAVFGAIIPVVAAVQGLRALPGSQGVGEASTKTVVQSSLGIIIADLVLTYLLYA